MEAGSPCLVEPGMALGLGPTGMVGATEGSSRRQLNHKARTTTLVTSTPTSNLAENQMAHSLYSDQNDEKKKEKRSKTPLCSSCQIVLEDES